MEAQLCSRYAQTNKQGEQQTEVWVARSVADVEFLRDAWMRWQGHRDSDIDFYLMIVQSYAEALRPHVLALYRNGDLDAILVGRLERKRLAFSVGYLRPFCPWVRCITFVYGAMHGNCSLENTRIFLQEIMGELRRKEADIAILEFVPIDSPLYSRAVALPGILSRDASTVPQEHHAMEITASIDDVYRRMSHDRRKDIRRKMRKFEATYEGQLRIVCCRSESELDFLFRDAEEIAGKTYQRGLGAGFRDTPRVRERLGLAARQGWLRSYLLYVGRRPCAFWVGMLYGDTFLGEYTGYDPEFSQFSPGMFLMLRVIEGFCNGESADNVKEIDFGLGHAEYKAALCNKCWLEAPVYIFSPTLKGLTLKLMRTMTRVADRMARRALSSTHLLQLLKKKWRKRLADKSHPVSGSINKSGEFCVH